MNKEIMELAKELFNLYEEAYNTYKPQVQGIIDNHIKNADYIENIIDRTMDIYTDKGFYLCLKLILYYRQINYAKARDYIRILSEQRKDEYNEFMEEVKKEQKILKK